MGLYTLENFREELDRILGSGRAVSDRMTRWVNFAYFELAGSFDFNELQALSTFPTVVSTGDYAVPASTRLVTGVRNDTADFLLEYVNPAELFRLSSANGESRKWTRFGPSVYLRPTPVAVVDITMMRKISPTQLTVDSDVTVLDATWDPAIMMLSAFFALLALHESEARVSTWAGRTISYIRSRATQEELFTKEHGLGLSLALPLETRMMALQEAARASGAPG